MKTKKIIRLLAVILTVLFFAAAAHAELLGNSKTKKYHGATCRLVEKLKPENKVVFKDGAEAQKSGYTACKVCKPDDNASTNKKNGKNKNQKEKAPPSQQ